MGSGGEWRWRVGVFRSARADFDRRELQGRFLALRRGCDKARCLNELPKRLEDACRITSPAPVLEAVGSTRPARWFRRPVCGPECGPGGEQ